MSAFGEGREDVDDSVSVETLYNRALALKQAARWQDALVGFERVESRLDEASGDRHDLGRRTLVMKIACLEELHQSGATVVACDEFATRYGGQRQGLDEVGLLADVLWIKSRTLNRTGDTENEHAVNELLIAEFGHGPPLGSVAGAMYNEGIYLRDAGRGDEAVALWDELWTRFSKEWPDSAGFLPVLGQLAKSTYLARTGQLDRALLTCDRMLSECQQRSLPDDEVRRAQRRCVQIAARKRGLAARLRGRLNRG